MKAHRISTTYGNTFYVFTYKLCWLNLLNKPYVAYIRPINIPATEFEIIGDL